MIKQQVELRITERVIECFHKGERIASHRRDDTKLGYTTVPDHMPRAHREYVAWTPQRLINWAAETGSACRELIERLPYRHRYPQQGFRSAPGILRLGKINGSARLEAACARALSVGSTIYRSVDSILKRGQEQPGESPQDELALEHANVRGATYYH